MSDITIEVFRKGSSACGYNTTLVVVINLIEGDNHYNIIIFTSHLFQYAVI